MTHSVIQCFASSASLLCVGVFWSLVFVVQKGSQPFVRSSSAVPCFSISSSNVAEFAKVATAHLSEIRRHALELISIAPCHWADVTWLRLRALIRIGESRL